MILLQGRTEALGYVPSFLNEDDPRPAVEQIDSNYAHGGGWRDFDGFDVQQDEHGRYRLTYPGDPAYREQARILFRDEVIVAFSFAWFLVASPGKAHRIARLD